MDLITATPVKSVTCSCWPLCLCICSPPAQIPLLSRCLVHLSMSRWSAIPFIKPSLTTPDSTNLSTLHILFAMQASLNQVANMYLVFQITRLTFMWFQAYSFGLIHWTVSILKVYPFLNSLTSCLSNTYWSIRASLIENPLTQEYTNVERDLTKNTVYHLCRSLC